MGALLEGRTVVVTGANVGIGLETARGLARLGAEVVLTSRDRAKGEAALAEVRRTEPSAKLHMALLDLASLARTRACAEDLLARFPRIHVLVNNAGLLLTDRRESADGHELTFATNHLGPFLLTQLLLPRLLASTPARIVNVASRAHTRAPTAGLDFDDLMARRRYSGVDAYAKSKLANILHARELARRLEGKGVTANSLHPGVVRTGFAMDGDARGIVGLLWRLARPFFLSAADGARTSIHVASAPELERVSGRYFDRCAEARPSRAALDDAAARRLWDESERLLGGR